MIVQYVIDWHYVRALIQGAMQCATANGDKLEVIRLQLRSLRSGIMRNGVLFAAEDPGFLSELQNIISEDLKQADGGETGLYRMNLSNELRACQKAYDEKCIRLPLEDGDDSFLDILKARNQMLAEANLSIYDLPCAIITNRNVDALGNTVSMTLDRYEDSCVEECRARWEGVSFSANSAAGNVTDANSTNPEENADRFWAGLSMGASAFRHVSIIDPFCLCVVFRDTRLSNWDASIDKILGFFIRNKFIENITLVGQGTIVGRTMHVRRLLMRLQNELFNLGVRRKGKFTVGIRVKPPTDNWHDRWIDVGIAICALDDGLEVYKKENDGAPTVIRKPFQVHALRDESRAQFNVVNASRNETYQCVINGRVRIDVEDVSQLRPSDANNVVEFDVWPRIVIN